MDQQCCLRCSFFIVFIMVSLILGQEDDSIDLYDLLDENLMPEKLLLLENIPNNSPSHLNNTKTEEIQNGSPEEALSTMVYHRKMMNEFLCRNYVSEKIVTEMTLIRTKRKTGNVTDYPQGKDTRNLPEMMLYDEGSTKYKEWLQRSSTLEDIYRQFENPNANGNTKDNSGNARNDGNKANPNIAFPGPTAGSSAKVGYVGDIGYGYNVEESFHPLPNQPGPSPYAHHVPPSPSYEGVSYEEKHHYIPKYYYNDKKKEELTKLFEIALTALAFLSFKMFLVHVLMCIATSGSSYNGTTYGGTPVTMSLGPPPFGTRGGSIPPPPEEGPSTESGEYPVETAGGEGEDNPGGDVTEFGGTSNGDTEGNDGEETGTEEAVIETDNDDDTEIITSEDGDGITFRFKRNINKLWKNDYLNDLARKILVSVDSALIAENDNGECLRRSLCENNKYSRTVKENGKYWIPVWSLGMSWLSSKVIEDLPPSTSMMESLKASLLGLGNADCEFLYRNCNFDILRSKLLK